MAYQNDRITSIPAPLPKDYDRGFSFTDFQTINPSSPMPGASLDNELAGVEQALDETQARARLIQRDDGALKNGIVDSDALADSSVGLKQLKPESYNALSGTGVIQLSDITSLSSLNTAALVDGQQFDRREWWPGTGVGGSKEVWDPNMPVSMHNGGTIKDPAKISELNTTTKTFSTYFTADTLSGNTGCFVVSYDKGEISPFWFGALGQGSATSAADTGAIDACFSFLEANPALDGTVINGARDIYLMYAATVIHFGSGEFHYSGSGYTPVNNKVVVIKADSPSTAIIHITSDSHLVRPNNTSRVMAYVEFSDIKIMGGRGAFFNTKTDIGNVGHGKRVFNCVFAGYTSVAFGSIQEFDARWHIQHSVFDGSNTGTPVGLYLPDEVAEPDISGNSFSGNKYDVIFNDAGISEFCFGPNNSFFNLSGRVKEANLWLIPGASIRHGSGLRIIDNRMSNENLDVAKPNILVADRDGATAVNVFSHLTTESTGIVNGITVDRMSMISTGNPSTSSAAVGFIFTYTPNLSLKFSGNILGQWRPYVLEYASGITATEVDAGAARVNYARLNFMEKAYDAYQPIKFSNIDGAGLLEYDADATLGAPGTLQKTSDGTVGFAKVHTASNTRLWNKGANVTQTDIADAQGGTTGSTFTYGADQVVIAGLTVGNIIPGYQMWLECDVRASASKPLRAIQIESSIRSKVIDYTLDLTSEWQRIRIPVICASGSHTGTTFFIQFAPRLFLNVGVADSFDIGRFCLYHSQGPVDYSVSAI